MVRGLFKRGLIESDRIPRRAKQLTDEAWAILDERTGEEE